MNKLILVVAYCVVFSANANAGNACEKIARLSGSIMDARQRGVPILDIMHIFEAGKTKDQVSTNKLAKSLVMDAYETPKFSTTTNKKEASTEFVNKQMVKCLRIAE